MGEVCCKRTRHYLSPIVFIASLDKGLVSLGAEVLKDKATSIFVQMCSISFHAVSKETENVCGIMWV